MGIFEVITGTLLLCTVLLDAFQTIILPRRPVGRLRITRFFFQATWGPWRWAAQHHKSRKGRGELLSVYGPLSLRILFFLWAFLLVFGYGLIFFGLKLSFHDPLLGFGSWSRLRSCLYVSGTTIFTLGLGDVLPQSHAARLLTVMEAGTGLGFIALVIGYVPVMYSSFSKREVEVALLDARAGSPPTATELLLRHNFTGGVEALNVLLQKWEGWAAEILETHISYPILCFYRSQHDNQSWLAALTTILDTCALLIATSDATETRQAQLTFAMGRHVLTDLVHVFRLEQKVQQLREGRRNRLSAGELTRVCQELRDTRFAPCGRLQGSKHAGRNLDRLQSLRLLYEPSACALADYLQLTIPPWVASMEPARRDTWALMKGMDLPRAERLDSHVSLQSTALHLQSHDGVE